MVGPTGETLARASVWLAMLCYPAGPAGRRSRPELCRAIWTLGCVAFLVHVASSFAVHYGWSHTILRAIAPLALATRREFDTALAISLLRAKKAIRSRRSGSSGCPTIGKTPHPAYYS